MSLKLKLMKVNKFEPRLHDGYEDNSLVLRSLSSVPVVSNAPVDQKQMVAGILDDVSTMLIKLPSSPLSKSVQALFNSNRATVSFRLDNNSNLDRVPRFNSTITYINNKPAYIGAASTSIGVNLNSDNILDSLDGKKAVNTLYHGVVRLSVLNATDHRLLTSTSKIYEFVTEYYFRYLKHTLSLSTLDDHKSMLLDYTISRMLHKVAFKSNNRMTKELAFDYIRNKYPTADVELLRTIRGEVDDVDSLFGSAKSMKDIFKILEVLQVSFDNEASQISKVYSSIGIQNYLSMTSTFDFMVAAIILSLYDKFYIKLQLDPSLIKSIEVEVVKLSKKIKYGT